MPGFGFFPLNRPISVKALTISTRQSNRFLPSHFPPFLLIDPSEVSTLHMYAPCSVAFALPKGRTPVLYHRQRWRAAAQAKPPVRTASSPAAEGAVCVHERSHTNGHRRVRAKRACMGVGEGCMHCMCAGVAASTQTGRVQRGPAK